MTFKFILNIVNQHKRLVPVTWQDILIYNKYSKSAQKTISVTWQDILIYNKYSKSAEKTIPVTWKDILIYNKYSKSAQKTGAGNLERHFNL